MILKNLLDSFWKIFIVVIALHHIHTQVSPELLDNYVWTYLVPIMGIVWAMIPTVEILLSFCKSNVNHSKSKQPHKEEVDELE